MKRRSSNCTSSVLPQHLCTVQHCTTQSILKQVQRTSCESVSYAIRCKVCARSESGGCSHVPYVAVPMSVIVCHYSSGYVSLCRWAVPCVTVHFREPVFSISFSPVDLLLSAIVPLAACHCAAGLCCVSLYCTLQGARVLNLLQPRRQVPGERLLRQVPAHLESFRRPAAAHVQGPGGYLRGLLEFGWQQGGRVLLQQ